MRTGNRICLLVWILFLLSPVRATLATDYYWTKAITGYLQDWTSWTNILGTAGWPSNSGDRAYFRMSVAGSQYTVARYDAPDSVTNAYAEVGNSNIVTWTTGQTRSVIYRLSANPSVVVTNAATLRTVGIQVQAVGNVRVPGGTVELSDGGSIKAASFDIGRAGVGAVVVSNAVMESTDGSFSGFEYIGSSRGRGVLGLVGGTNLVAGSWFDGKDAYGTGVVSMSAGSLIRSTNASASFYIGFGLDSFGQLTCVDSTIDIAGQLYVGDEGRGDLYLTNSTMFAGGATIGLDFAGSSGTVVMAGSSIWSNRDYMVIGGDAGFGQFILAGGDLTVPYFDLRARGLFTFSGGVLNTTQSMSSGNSLPFVVGDGSGAAGEATWNVMGGAITLPLGLEVRSDGCVNFWPGTVLNAPSITCSGVLSCPVAFSFPADVSIEGMGAIESGAGPTWTIDGNFHSASTNAGFDLLHSGIVMSPAITHQFSLGCIDRGRTLAGFDRNQALGTLDVHGNVELQNTAYVWSLTGDGALRIGTGASFYYVVATNWSGTVELSGSGTFEQVPVQIGSVNMSRKSAITLTWPAGADLNFEVGWTTNVESGLFSSATGIVATGSSESWTDEGAADRSSSSNATYRYYRLQAWP